MTERLINKDVVHMQSMKKLHLILFILLFLPSVYGGEKDDPIVWVDKDVSLTGNEIFVILPVSNDSGNDIDAGITNKIQQQIVSALKESGYKVSLNTDQQGNDAVTVRTTLISYKTGDAFGRWIGMGEGVAKCTIRSSLLEGATDNVIADIISTKVVDIGGFFTIGADKRISDDVTKEVTDAIINLIRKTK